MAEQLEGVSRSCDHHHHRRTEAAAAASLRLRDELLAILGADLVSAWVHGGTTFADRPVRPGDLDICAVIANVAPSERTPRVWRARSWFTTEPHRRRAGVDRSRIRRRLRHDVPARGRDRRWPAPCRRIREEATRDGLGGLSRPLAGRSVRPAAWASTRRARRRADGCGAPPSLGPRARASRATRLRGRRHDPYEATYAIFNGCRILRTLETGSPVISKRSAGEWGLANLPDRWHGAIHAAGRSYDGAATAEDNETPLGTPCLPSSTWSDKSCPGRTRVEPGRLDGPERPLALSAHFGRPWRHLKGRATCVDGSSPPSRRLRLSPC